MHFNASVTFLLLVLENLTKYHKGDFAGHCSIYIHVYTCIHKMGKNDVMCIPTCGNFVLVWGPQLGTQTNK